MDTESQRSCGEKAGRRGSITIEFAFLLPVLLTLMLLCVDFGRFAHNYIAVTNAARAGAAFGMMNNHSVLTKPIWDAGVRQAIEDEMAANSWYDSADLQILETSSVDEGNGFRRVTISINYSFRTVLDWPFIPGYNDPVDLHRKVVVRGIR